MKTAHCVPVVMYHHISPEIGPITTSPKNFDDQMKGLVDAGYSTLTCDEFADFLKEIDFDYDDGFGCQELFGNVWFDDGSWLDRGEYDGAEWWSYRRIPEIPAYLSNN